MKLIFTKNENNEVNVQLQKGTVAEDFTYTEMIKQLLELNRFDDTVYNNISEDEKVRIEGMLKKINDILEEDENSDEL